MKNNSDVKKCTAQPYLEPWKALTSKNMTLFEWVMVLVIAIFRSSRLQQHPG